MISSHLALPREKDLNQMHHTLSYLKKYHNVELVLGPLNPAVGTSEFERRDYASNEFKHILNEGIEMLTYHILEELIL